MRERCSWVCAEWWMGGPCERSCRRLYRLVGAGGVNAWWDWALPRMTKEEKATVVRPPHLAYGSVGAGGVIPPNAILKFASEVLDVK